MIITLIVLFLIFLSVGLAFNFQNLDLINVNFWFFSFDGPVGLIIVAAFVVGLIIPVFLMLPSILNRGYKIRNLNKELEKMKKRVDDSAMMFETGGLGQEGETYKHN